jgi:hypothetical protein
MSTTVRGKAKVEWRPDFTLTFTSTDGLTLDPGTETHPLVATLTNTVDGSPVEGRTIKLTTSPERVGHGEREMTDGEGKCTFEVSNVATESVVYTASVIPRPPTSEPTVTADLTIQWGGVICNQCNADIDIGPVEVFQPNEVPESLGYVITYTVHTESGDGCAIITNVTHAEGFYYVFSSGDGNLPDFSSYDVVEVTFEDTGPFDQDFVDEQTPILEATRDAQAVPIQADAC